MAYNKNTGLYEGFIYKIWNDVNDKIYIGQVKRNINVRWNEHCSAGNNWESNKEWDHSVLHKAMSKYGINMFHIEEINKIANKSYNDLCKELDSLEIYYIDKYDCIAPKGYNIALGGRTPVGLSNSAVDVYNYNKQLLYEFDSIIEAASFLGIHRSNIIFQCINHKPNKFNQYIFRYHEDKITDTEIEECKIKNPEIYQYDINGNKLHTFKNIREAAKNIQHEKKLKTKLSFLQNRIMTASICDNKSAYGYIWRKYPDTFNSYEIPKLLIERDYARIEQRDSVTGEIINVFDSLNDVILKYPSFKKGTVQRACKVSNNDAHIHAYGYLWNYEGQFNKLNLNKFQQKKIYQYSLTGELIATYDSLKQAAESVGTNSISSISNCCNQPDKYKTCYGYIWSYSSEILNINLKRSRPLKGRAINCYNTQGVLLKSYKNIKEAEIDTNVSHALILSNVNGRSIRCHDKYIFRYDGEPFDKYRTKRKNSQGVEINV